MRILLLILVIGAGCTTRKITIGEVIKSPDEKLSREMIRVIRSSKGKWTPRKVRGVPQRTAYEYGVNFLGMAE